MPEPLVVFTASLPPAVLSPNKRPHYMQRANAAKDYRALGRIKAEENPLPDHAKDGWLMLDVQATPAKPGHTGPLCCPRDSDNGVATLKNLRDGLADGWGLADDAKIVTTWRKVKRTPGSPTSGWLTIWVYPMEDPRG